MSRQELYLRESTLVARIGCGHTSVLPAAGYTKSFLRGARVLPIRVVVLGERPFVSQACSDAAKALLGAGILSINGRDAAEIRERLVGAHPRDGRNPAFAVSKVNDMFPFLYRVLADPAETFRLRVRRPGDEGAFAEVELEPEPARSVVAEYRRQDPEGNFFDPPHGVEMFVDAEDGVAYLRVLGFDRFGRGEERFRSFFREIEEKGVSALVLDLRRNRGGFPDLALDLLRYLLPEPFTYLGASGEDVEVFTECGFETYYEETSPHPAFGFRGDLYVLLDGGTFSQAGQLASMLEDRATFVGEESGGSFSCNDDARIRDLPERGFRLRVATAAFETSARGLPRDRGLVPGVTIRPSVEDLLAGRDPVLGWIDRRLGTDFAARRDVLPAGAG